MTAKGRIRDLLNELPEDTSYDEVIRELLFARMVDRGLADAREGRTISHEGRKGQT